MFGDDIERSVADLASLPRRDESGLQLRWFLDRYDGPLNGWVTHGEDHFWFEYHCDDSENYRCYRLYRLSECDQRLLHLWKLGETIFQQDVRAVTQGEGYRETREYQAFMARWRAFLNELPKFEQQREPEAWFVAGSNPSFHAITVTTVRDRGQ